MKEKKRKKEDVKRMIMLTFISLMGQKDISTFELFRNFLKEPLQTT